MALDHAEALRFSRKVGYGLRPEENPGDVFDWAISQLDTVPGSVGVANRASEAGKIVVPWPRAKIWSLEQRVQNLVIFRTTVEHLEKQFDSNSSDYGKRRRDLERDHSVVAYDILRHCHRAIYSPAPVFVRFSNFWRNHFSVGDKETCNELVGHMVDEAIDANMTKTFADMLYDVTSHPAMQTYLDNIYSSGPHSANTASQRAQGHQADINENLARELLELHTVSPAAQYTQSDIVEVAKVLTGWGYIANKPEALSFPDKWYAFVLQRHEPGNKHVMGRVFAAGKGALRELTDFLAVQDSTINHLAQKLARHFIRETPLPDDVTAITTAWKKSNGSLVSIHRAVVERAAVAIDARKFQQPETWLFQVARMSGATPFIGFDEVGLEIMEPYERDAAHILRELGQNSWDVRQPDGFSDFEVDWVSPEHMDRRTRFSELVFRGGNSVESADRLLERNGAGEGLTSLVAKGASDKDKFILFWCSRQMMEA